MMAKTVKIEWKPFFRGEIIEQPQQMILLRNLSSGALIAVSANGKESGSWVKLLQALWDISDWLCIGVIIFAGASWMFNNRTKAIEYLTGGAVGYLIIKHAKDIQDFLDSI